MTELVPHDKRSLALAEKLESSGFLTSTGLDLEKLPDLNYEQLASLVAFFRHLGEVSLWGLYDSLLLIERQYGDDFMYQAAEITKRQPQTIDNNLSIARRVPRSRRREEVHFSTHAEVAALPPNDQKRWLKIVVEENLTKAELRARIQAERDGHDHILPLEQELCPSCGRPI